MAVAGAALVLTAQPSCASVESGVDAYNGGDYPRAMHDLFPLADKGNNPIAQRYVAAMYADGYGVTQDEKAAAGWYLSAATGGNIDAQIILGDFYANGRGVVADPVLAAYWHWRASSGMLNAAKRALGEGAKKDTLMLGKPGAADSAKESGCSAPSYAADAAHFGQDSSVELLFLVDAEGKAQQVSVGTSSTWPLLDNLARDAFAHCSFPPVAQNGKPAPALIKATYTWKTK